MKTIGKRKVAKKSRSGEAKLINRIVQKVGTADNWLLQRVLIGVGVFAVLFILLAVDFSPTAISGLEISKPSPATVKAPRSIEVVDEERTQELRRDAADQVEAVRVFDETRATKARAEVNAFFLRLTQALNNKDASETVLTDTVRTILPSADLESDLDWMVSLSAERIKTLRSQTNEITATFMAEKISAQEIDGKRDEALRRGQVMEHPRAGRLVGELAAGALRVNNVVDKEETNDRIRSAVDKVEPVTVTKLAGETIVTEGEIVTPVEAQILDELGLTNQLMGRTWQKTLGQALIAFVLVILGLVYLREFQPRVYRDNRLLLLLFVVLATVSATAKGLSPMFPPFLIPAAAAAMLTTILVRRTAGIMMAVTTSIVTGIIVSDSQYWVFAFVIGLFAVYMTSNISHRSDLTRAGLWLVLASGSVALVVGLIENETGVNLLVNGGWGALGGFGAIVLTIGTLQFLEYAFNITTDMKLLELANPTQPLLKELMVNAPGTYNHSIMTGNLVESVAPQVGANPLLARAGAYYHDIGKIRRPFFFVENQYGENPHDKTQPNLSYLIISAHVKEGVELAKKHRLPKEVVDIIAQHHGTTLVSYFYSRAKESAKHADVAEDQYRYPGEKPKSKEAALIMLADAVEAAVRALTKPTHNRIEQLVRKIIKERMYDGQLDECRLTLGDLETVTVGYAQTLTTMYHSRIEYPDPEKPARKRGVVVGHFGDQPIRS